MSNYKTHIVKRLFLFIYLCIGVSSYAQLKAGLNDVTTLAVNELTGVNYEWEIYDQPPTDFATTTGSVPSIKAVFVNGNIGSSVQVKWLKSGTYFYKVISKNSCTNNLKVGKVIVKPHKPSINVYYDCVNNTAELTATAYEGTLKWSTGATTEQINVNQGGTYTLTQTIDGAESHPVEVFIANPEGANNPDISDMPTTVYLDEEVSLSATGCDRGEIHWYTDKELTKEVSETKFNVKENTTYYAVCVTDAGCESEVSTLSLIVEYQGDDCEDMFGSLDGKIENSISPNGDGSNDVWSLEELYKYCEKCNKTANIEIFNRWGNTVYKQDGYFSSSNKFRGQTHNATGVVAAKKKLPVGTYFYVITTEGNKKITGWIYVSR